MKFENNWKVKTLENLEGKYFGDPPFNSHLVKTCYALRKKPLKDFEIEDLRIMIGQNRSLDYLIPLAIDKLKQNILSEGDFFEGDLLKNVLNSERDYWQREKENWKIVCELFTQKEQLILDSGMTSSIRKSLFESFANFKKLK